MTWQRRARIDPRDDRGFTMTELIVAMGLLTVFMAMFTAATMLMTNTTTKVQRISASVEQVNRSFLTLDRTVRYASAIGPIAVSGAGVWHVEYSRSVVTNGSASDLCTQLRVANSQLQMRTWTVSGTGIASGSLGAWQVLSSNVTNGTLPATTTSDDKPFAVPPANSAAATQFQQLTITVVSAGDDPSGTETNRASMTFSALNSVAGVSSNVCQQVAVDVTS